MLCLNYEHVYSPYVGRSRLHKNKTISSTQIYKKGKSNQLIIKHWNVSVHLRKKITVIAFFQTLPAITSRHASIAVTHRAGVKADFTSCLTLIFRVHYFDKSLLFSIPPHQAAWASHLNQFSPNKYRAARLAYDMKLSVSIFFLSLLMNAFNRNAHITCLVVWRSG